MLAWHKTTPFLFSLDIFYAMNVERAAAMHVIISFIYLEAPHDVFTSLQLSTDCEQVETHLENVCVSSEVR